MRCGEGLETAGAMENHRKTCRVGTGDGTGIGRSEGRVTGG